MICERCGVVNRAGRTTCIHCLGPLKNGVPAEGAVCAEHPGEPATGRCVTCGKLVCEACGGVVSNRGVYCIDHTPAVTTSASASPGMNPLLGGGADSAAGSAMRAKASVDRGTIAAIAGLVALLVYFGLAFGYPGFLRSKELPAAPVSTAGGMGGYGAAGGYGAGTGYPGPGPYGSGGPGSDTGAPGGSYGGPPGGPPGGPAGASSDTSSPSDTAATGLGKRLRGVPSAD
jgi:hypothetical protein